MIVPDVGGAFGSKGVIAPEVAAVAVAAIELSRPLKWAEDRFENFLAAYQGRGVEGELELALDAAGRMLALRGRLRADLGAYLLTTTAIPPRTAAMLLTGCYDIPAAAVELVGVRTHKVPTGSVPGRGAAGRGLHDREPGRRCRPGPRLRPDRAATAQPDPILPPSQRSSATTYDSGDYERCLDLALELGRIEEVSSGEPDRIAGSGVALYVERAGGQWEARRSRSCPTGASLCAAAALPHGQGHETTFAQIAADRLGIALDQIVLRFSDSAEVPRGVGTFGSRSVAVGGSAVAVAVGKLLERVRSLAAHELEVPRTEVSWQDGRFCAGGRALSLADLARLADQPERLGLGMEPGLSAAARFESPPVFSSGAYAVAVEIERDTGRLHVLRVVAVDDAGTIINPLLSHGQVIGGAVQGLGECLAEEAVFDETGQPLSVVAAELPAADRAPTYRRSSPVRSRARRR